MRYEAAKGTICGDTAKRSALNCGKTGAWLPLLKPTTAI